MGLPSSSLAASSKDQERYRLFHLEILASSQSISLLSDNGDPSLSISIKFTSLNGPTPACSDELAPEFCFRLLVVTHGVQPFGYRYRNTKRW